MAKTKKSKNRQSESRKDFLNNNDGDSSVPIVPSGKVARNDKRAERARTSAALAKTIADVEKFKEMLAGCQADQGPRPCSSKQKPSKRNRVSNEEDVPEIKKANRNSSISE